MGAFRASMPEWMLESGRGTDTIHYASLVSLSFEKSLPGPAAPRPPTRPESAPTLVFSLYAPLSSLLWRPQPRTRLPTKVSGRCSDIVRNFEAAKTDVDTLLLAPLLDRFNAKPTGFRRHLRASKFHCLRAFKPIARLGFWFPRAP